MTSSPGDVTGIPVTTDDYITFIPLLGAALDTLKLTTKIAIMDDNFSNSSFADTVLADPTVYSYADSVAWHGYGGNPTAQTAITDKYPNIAHDMTELRRLASDDWNSTVAVMGCDIGVQVPRNGGRSITLWNLALDENGGPIVTSSTGRRGVVTIDSSTHAVTRNCEYYMLRHIGQFVKPGAVRVTSTSFGVGESIPTLVSATVQNAAFLNPDGTIAVFVVNNAPTSQTFQIIDHRSQQGFPVTMAASEMATFVWG